MRTSRATLPHHKQSTIGAGSLADRREIDEVALAYPGCDMHRSRSLVMRNCCSEMTRCFYSRSPQMHIRSHRAAQPFRRPVDASPEADVQLDAADVPKLGRRVAYLGEPPRRHQIPAAKFGMMTMVSAFMVPGQGTAKKKLRIIRLILSMSDWGCAVRGIPGGCRQQLAGAPGSPA